MDKALPKVTQLQGFQPHLKSQRAKLGCSRLSQHLSHHRFKLNVTDLRRVGFDFAQPTLRHIKGFGDLTRLIERAIRFKLGMGSEQDAKPAAWLRLTHYKDFLIIDIKV